MVFQLVIPEHFYQQQKDQLDICMFLNLHFNLSGNITSPDLFIFSLMYLLNLFQKIKIFENSNHLT